MKDLVADAALEAAEPYAEISKVLAGAPLLQDQTVILTGAAGGIGQVTAQLFAAAGARLAVTDRDAESLTAVVDGLRLGEATFIFEGIDASAPGEFLAFYERTVSELGPVDGLVNCAGAWEAASFEEIEPESLAAMLAANLVTAFIACQAVLPAMVDRRRGSVVNFASTAGEYGSISPAAHYAAAKGGVIALTKSLAREVSPFNVRVNALSPGPIDTPSLVGSATPEQRAKVGERTLFGRLGQPHEIAAACAFLLSPLSTFMTGQVLGVNGGSLL
jgi:NAD(P)-dependent dehydrogenase (short-subunit alcohol dehydrogenase family)